MIGQAQMIINDNVASDSEANDSEAK